MAAKVRHPVGARAVRARGPPGDRRGCRRLAGRGRAPSERDELMAGAMATLMLGGWPEPFGLVAIESMATGTPVIARRAGAYTETVEHGRTGFLVDDVDEAVLALGRIPASTGRRSPPAPARGSRPTGWWTPTSTRTPPCSASACRCPPRRRRWAPSSSCRPARGRARPGGRHGGRRRGGDRHGRRARRSLRRRRAAPGRPRRTRARRLHSRSCRATAPKTRCRAPGSRARRPSPACRTSGRSRTSTSRSSASPSTRASPTASAAGSGPTPSAPRA